MPPQSLLATELLAVLVTLAFATTSTSPLGAAPVPDRSRSTTGIGGDGLPRRQGDADAAAPMGEDEARHLLARTGFGVQPGPLRRLAALSREQAIDLLLTTLRTEPATPHPSWVDLDIAEHRAPAAGDEEARRRFRMLQRRRGQELKEWWLGEMIATDSPFTERLTLFWHGHFTSSLRKVRAPLLLYNQNVMLRRHAAGSFRELLEAIVLDPAMVVYLDTQRSRREHPNENFARELLELFTLGEGHYSEGEIREVARAFTGYRVRLRDGVVQFLARQHDDGDKTIRGRTGAWDAPAVVELLLEDPRTAVHITEKLWRELVSAEPAPDTVVRIATVFRENDYSIRALLRALLSSEEFWDPAHRAALVRSPVDLVVGTVRTLQLPVWDLRRLVQLCRRLGQDLYDPPTVQGWPGGEEWVDTSTLLERRQFLRTIATPQAGGGGRAGSGDGGRYFYTRWLLGLGEDPGERLACARRLLLPMSNGEGAADGDPVARVRSWLLDPLYQLH